MGESKLDLLQGTLDVMVLRTLDAMGPLHGYGIARRIEQVSGNEVLLNQGTIYASLVRLQQRGWIAAKWGTSDNNRKAKFYSITKVRPEAAGKGHRLLAATVGGDGAGAFHADGREVNNETFPSRGTQSHTLIFPQRLRWIRISTKRWLHHLEMAVEENLARGCLPEEARRQALSDSAECSRPVSEHRESRGLPWLDVLMQDLRFTFRTLRRDRGFTIVAVLILALASAPISPSSAW